MPVSFEELRIGDKYERPFLAELWGYNSYQAISRGVVTPSGTNYIIFFVTRIKQGSLTQYDDYLEGDRLFWEGEERHGSDTRIINSTNSNDEIHLFYRDIHHTPFVYYGQIYLKEYTIHNDRPSQFDFSIKKITIEPDELDDIENHRVEIDILDSTEREAVYKSRIGQGLFRDRLIGVWGGCAVTGLDNLSLLRASHIKPWRFCSNKERLNPMNGLLLQPTLDHLFDLGFIAFDGNGKIQFSNDLSDRDIALLDLDQNWSLRLLPSGVKDYLEYHREKVFCK